MFDDILGNEPVKAYLRKALQQGALPHALLFAGLDGIGKSLFAQELGAQLLETTLARVVSGNHPDYHPMRPDGKSGLHSIESIRDLIEKVHSTPFEAPAQVFLIADAERMQPAAANALLKTLEEPTPDTALILLTHSPNEILPTILSRCAKVIFQPLTEQEIGSLLQKQGHPVQFAKLAQGSAARALDLATRPSLEEPLFQLLAHRHLYSSQVLALERLEELIEDEDPVRKNRNAERLFASLLMWHRDQHARKMGCSVLFFPEAPAVSFSLPSLESVQKRVDEAHLAFQRNIKLSVCLGVALNQ